MFYYSLDVDDDGYSFIKTISDDPSIFEASDMVFVKETLPIVSGDVGIDLQLHKPYQGRLDASVYLISDSEGDWDKEGEDSFSYRVQIYEKGNIIDDFYE